VAISTWVNLGSSDYDYPVELVAGNYSRRWRVENGRHFVKGKGKGVASVRNGSINIIFL
jgi:hypothetical protein